MILYVVKSDFYRPFNVKWAEVVWSRKTFRDYLSIGLPGSVQYCAEASAFTGAAVIMGWIGTEALAAHQIAINLASMTFMFALGTSVAAAVRVGEFFGARKMDRARDAGFTAIFVAAVFMGACGIVFFFCREILPAFYIADKAVISITAQLLIVAAFFQFFDGAQGVAMGALRGVMDTKWPMIVTVVAYWVVSLPVGYFMGIKFQYGAIGVWVGLLVGLVCSSLALSIRFHLLTKLRI